MNGCARRLPTYPFARNQTSVVQGQDANDMQEDFDNWTYTLREVGLNIGLICYAKPVCNWTYTLLRSRFDNSKQCKWNVCDNASEEVCMTMQPKMNSKYTIFVWGKGTWRNIGTYPGVSE